MNSHYQGNAFLRLPWFRHLRMNLTIQKKAIFFNIKPAFPRDYIYSDLVDASSDSSFERVTLFNLFFTSLTAFVLM